MTLEEYAKQHGYVYRNGIPFAFFAQAMAVAKEIQDAGTPCLISKTVGGYFYVVAKQTKCASRQKPLS